MIRAVDGLNRLACWLMAGLMLGMTLCTLWRGVSALPAYRARLERGRAVERSIALPDDLDHLSRRRRGLPQAQLIALELVVTLLPAPLGAARAAALLGCLVFFTLMIYLGLQVHGVRRDRDQSGAVHAQDLDLPGHAGGFRTDVPQHRDADRRMPAAASTSATPASKKPRSNHAFSRCSAVAAVRRQHPVALSLASRRCRRCWRGRAVAGVPQTMFESMDSFALMAVPFFVLAGL